MTREYARVYYDDLMAEFPEVYRDDALLATWLRLLILAEKMWPIGPEIPRSVRIKTYARLVEAGLVEPADDQCYRIRGLDAERSRRQDAARNAAAVRWHSDRNADAYAKAMPRRDETRTKQDEKDDARDDLEAFLEVRRRPPSEKQRRILDEVLDRHDVTGPAWSAAIIRANPDDPIGAVIAADKQWKAERMAEANKVEVEHNRRKRNVPKWFDEYKAWASSDEEPAA